MGESAPTLLPLSSALVKGGISIRQENCPKSSNKAYPLLIRGKCLENSVAVKFAIHEFRVQIILAGWMAQVSETISELILIAMELLPDEAVFISRKQQQKRGRVVFIDAMCSFHLTLD
ncbi:hypothetical protein CEXT_646081 [Caerostris extrusa]|uniref:Uncharacterized protein n=1 Tax=Caerostris extrusa TaxID=172846 RepID=A0AAV4UJR7_CAEEX|nr:hypothetical protein CEXT_646081 [Caerostris extrusa]